MFYLSTSLVPSLLVPSLEKTGSNFAGDNSPFDGSGASSG
jgi:hypothetical protein